jgi:hypothetical protein
MIESERWKLLFSFLNKDGVTNLELRRDGVKTNEGS